jgi:hypothetical protein
MAFREEIHSEGRGSVKEASTPICMVSSCFIW